MAAFVEKEDLMLITEPNEDDDNTLDQITLEEGTTGQRTSNTA